MPTYQWNHDCVMIIPANKLSDAQDLAEKIMPGGRAERAMFGIPLNASGNPKDVITHYGTSCPLKEEHAKQWIYYLGLEVFAPKELEPELSDLPDRVKGIAIGARILITDRIAFDGQGKGSVKETKAVRVRKTEDDAIRNVSSVEQVFNTWGLQVVLPEDPLEAQKG